MTIVLLGLFAIACILIGVGIEAWLGGAHTSSLEHDCFMLEIELERLKREGH